VVSAKHPKKWPNVLECGAEFVDPPVAGREPPPVRIDVADGTSVTSDAADADAVLSRFFGREVEISSAAQNGYTIEQYHPDLDYDPEHRNELTDIKLGAAFFNERGLPSAVPEGSFFDLFPLSTRVRARDAHIALVGHITKDELLRYITATELANGFLNRFIIIAVQRSKELPFGGRLAGDELARVRDAVWPPCASPPIPRQLTFEPAARERWIDVYGPLSRGDEGLLGAATRRAEAHAVRLAAI